MLKLFSKTFKPIKFFLKLVEYLFLTLASIALLYFILIQLNIPQHIANNFIKKRIENTGWHTQIGELSGFFPISFKIDNIKLESLTGKKILLNNASIVFDWNSFSINTLVENVLLDGFEHETKRNDIQDNKIIENTNFLKKIPNITSRNIISFFEKYEWLKLFGIINVKYIKDSKSNICYSFVLNTKPGKQKTFLEIKADNDEFNFITTFSNISIINEFISADIFADYKNNKDLILKTNGNISISNKNITLNSKIYNNKIELANNSNLSANFVIEELFNFLNKDTNSSINQNEFFKLHLESNNGHEEILFTSSVLTNRTATFDIYKKNNEQSNEKNLFLKAAKSKILRGTKISHANIDFKNNDIKFFAQYGNIKEESNNWVIEETNKETSIKNIELKGNFIDKIINLEDIHGEIANKKIKLKKPFFFDLNKKISSEIFLNIDNLLFYSSKISFKNDEKSNFKLTPIHLFSKDRKDILYYGSYYISGDTEFKNEAPNLTIKIKSSFDEDQIQFLKSKGNFVQKFEISLDSNILITKDSVDIKYLKILSNKKHTTNIQLKLNPVSGKFMDIFYALKDIAEKKQESPLLEAQSLVKLEGKINGEFSLSPISKFFWNGDLIDGIITTNILIDGFTKSPKLKGTFILENGFYENLNNGVILKDVKMKAIGKDDSLKITNISLIDGTTIGRKSILENKDMNAPRGTAKGEGELKLFEYGFVPKLDINLNCNYFQVVYTDLVKARATGTLRINGPVHGKSTEAVITGDFVVNPMLINTSAVNTYMPIKNDVKIIRKNKNEKIQNIDSINPNRFKLNVKLNTGNRVVVIGDNSLQCFLKGQVDALGPLRNPYLLGNLQIDQTRNNTYNLFGRIMTPQKGTVKYSKDPMNDAYVDAIMKTKIGNTEIFANVHGFTSNLGVSLNSNPPLNNETILSLLLFKQNIDDLSENQRSQVKAFSSQMLQDNVFGFFDKIRNTIGLDSLEVVEKQDFSSGETIQSVRVGKQIKNVRVYVDQNLSKNDSKMIVRYDLTPQIGLEANVGTEKSSSGVGIKWSKRY